MLYSLPTPFFGLASLVVSPHPFRCLAPAYLPNLLISSLLISGGLFLGSLCFDFERDLFYLIFCLYLRIFYNAFD